MSKRLKTLRARARAAERDLGQAEKDLEAAEAALEDQMKETVLLRRERDDARKLRTAERESAQVLVDMVRDERAKLAQIRKWLEEQDDGSRWFALRAIIESKQETK
jgi:hypothetical protein